MKSESSVTVFTDFGIQKLPPSSTGLLTSLSYQAISGLPPGAAAEPAPAAGAAEPASLPAAGAALPAAGAAEPASLPAAGAAEPEPAAAAEPVASPTGGELPSGREPAPDGDPPP